MAVPFPEVTLGALVYVILGFMIASVFFLSYITYLLTNHLKTSEEDKIPRVDQIGLSRNAENILETVLEDPELQSDLPNRLEVSKATVSNSVSELADRGLIIRKKKGNTYLIEPEIDEIEKQQ